MNFKCIRLVITRRRILLKLPSGLTFWRAFIAMGTAFSKKKVSPKKPRVRKAHVIDYFYEPARKRPRSSQSSRDAKLIMSLGKVTVLLFFN